MKAGYNYGETTELFPAHYRVPQGQPDARATTATSPATRRRRWASSAASQLAGLPLFYGSYPITPASDILHELARHSRTSA